MTDADPKPGYTREVTEKETIDLAIFNNELRLTG
jgi:hypothetical protein